jgi:Rho termination factor, N-terminal domain
MVTPGPAQSNLKAERMNRARAIGIEGRSRMTKSELIEALRGLRSRVTP